MTCDHMIGYHYTDMDRDAGIAVDHFENTLLYAATAYGWHGLRDEIIQPHETIPERPFLFTFCPYCGERIEWERINAARRAAAVAHNADIERRRGLVMAASFWPNSQV